MNDLMWILKSNYKRLPKWDLLELRAYANCWRLKGLREERDDHDAGKINGDSIIHYLI